MKKTLILETTAKNIRLIEAIIDVIAGSSVTTVEKVKLNSKTDEAQPKKLSLENLQFSEQPRVQSTIVNLLKRAGINTVSQLKKKTRVELLQIPRLSTTSIESIEKALKK